jgi:F0F1-type ATP synthase delta subunit
MMKMLGIDTDELMPQIEEALSQFKKLCLISEQNQEMLVFLCEKLTPEETEKLQIRLDEVVKKYD